MVESLQHLTVIYKCNANGNKIANHANNEGFHEVHESDVEDYSIQSAKPLSKE